MNEMEEATSRRDTFFDEKERILRKCPCSVVIVKDEDRVAQMYENLP